VASLRYFLLLKILKGTLSGIFLPVFGKKFFNGRQGNSEIGFRSLPLTWGRSIWLAASVSHKQIMWFPRMITYFYVCLMIPHLDRIFLIWNTCPLRSCEHTIYNRSTLLNIVAHLCFYMFDYFVSPWCPLSFLFKESRIKICLLRDARNEAID